MNQVKTVSELGLFKVSLTFYDRVSNLSTKAGHGFFQFFIEGHIQIKILKKIKKYVFCNTIHCDNFKIIIWVGVFKKLFQSKMLKQIKMIYIIYAWIKKNYKFKNKYKYEVWFLMMAILIIRLYLQFMSDIDLFKTTFKCLLLSQKQN